MPRNPSTFARRQRELARQRKRVEKAKRRAERRDRRAELGELGPEDDPDIAGIVPGPQPLPYDDEEASAEDDSDSSDEAATPERPE